MNTHRNDFDQLPQRDAESMRFLFLTYCNVWVLAEHLDDKCDACDLLHFHRRAERNEAELVRKETKSMNEPTTTDALWALLYAIEADDAFVEDNPQLVEEARDELEALDRRLAR